MNVQHECMFFTVHVFVPYVYVYVCVSDCCVSCLSVFSYLELDGCEQRFFTCRFALTSLSCSQDVYVWFYRSHNHDECMFRIDILNHRDEIVQVMDLEDAGDRNKWKQVMEAMELKLTTIQQLANYLAKQTINEYGIPVAVFNIPETDRE